jgi:hypothetical protein
MKCLQLSRTFGHDRQNTRIVNVATVPILASHSIIVKKQRITPGAGHRLDWTGWQHWWHGKGPGKFALLFAPQGHWGASPSCVRRKVPRGFRMGNTNDLRATCQTGCGNGLAHAADEESLHKEDSFDLEWSGERDDGAGTMLHARALQIKAIFLSAFGHLASPMRVHGALECQLSSISSGPARPAKQTLGVRAPNTIIFSIQINTISLFRSTNPPSHPQHY